MTIKIIKSGVKPEERVAEFTCSVCNSVLTAKVSDGELILERIGRDGDNIKLKCPVCDYTITISLYLFKVPTSL